MRFRRGCRVSGVAEMLELSSSYLTYCGSSSRGIQASGITTIDKVSAVPYDSRSGTRVKFESFLP